MNFIFSVKFDAINTYICRRWRKKKKKSRRKEIASINTHRCVYPRACACVRVCVWGGGLAHIIICIIFFSLYLFILWSVRSSRSDIFCSLNELTFWSKRYTVKSSFYLKKKKGRSSNLKHLFIEYQLLMTNE